MSTPKLPPGISRVVVGKSVQYRVQWMEGGVQRATSITVRDGDEHAALAEALYRRSQHPSAPPGPVPGEESRSYVLGVRLAAAERKALLAAARGLSLSAWARRALLDCAAVDSEIGGAK